MPRLILPIWKHQGLVYTCFWLVVVAILFLHLGSGSLRLWDEGLSAERSREMLTLHEWLTPHLNGSPDFNKPPLYYWLTAATMPVLGRNEFAVRLWSVLFGIGCLCLVCLIVKRETGSWGAGHLAAMLLLTTPYWTNKTREGLLDSGMMFGLLAALALMEYGRGARSAVLAGLAAALSALVKGPVVLVVFVLQPLAWRWSGRGVYTWRRLAISAGVFVLTAGYWYAAQFFLWRSAFVEQYIGHSLIGQLTTNIEGRTGGVLYYFFKWPELAPLSAVLAVATLGIVYTHRKTFAREQTVWIALWTLSFVAIELAGSRRELYLYPAMTLTPIAALLAFAPLVRSWSARRRHRATGVLVLVAVSAFLFQYDKTPDHSRGIRELAAAWRTSEYSTGTVACFNVPPHLFSFYLDRMVPFAAGVSDMNEGNSYFVGKESEDLFLTQARAAGLATRRLGAKRDFVLYTVLRPK